MLRYLRIAFSATCLIACIFLIALWVRSYFRSEFLERYVDINILDGSGTKERIFNGPARLELTKDFIPGAGMTFHPTGWAYRRYDPVQDVGEESSWHFMHYRVAQGRFFHICLPHWFLIIAVGIAGMLPWTINITWSFSLRTLLIAVTTVAMVLGLIVWAVR